MKAMKVASKTFGVMIGVLLVLPMGAAFLVWIADGKNRGGLDTAHIFSTRYIVAVVLQGVILIPFFVYAHRRPVDATLTWGEAMVAAVYVFFVLFWAYGVVPHEFLNWADSELAWRPDKKVIGPEGTWAQWWSFWKKIPLTIHKQVFRDLIAVLIYVYGLGMLMWAVAFWNDRAKKATEAAAVVKVSQYGRPLVAESKG